MYNESVKFFWNNPQEGLLNRRIFFRYLLTGFFTGLFYIIIHALFLHRYDASDLALAYGIGGGLSVVLLSLWSLIPFHKRDTPILTLIAPLLAMLISITVCLLLRSENEGIPIFISFILLLPLWLLLLSDAGRQFRSEVRFKGSAGGLSVVANTTMITGFLAAALIIPGFISLGIRPETIVILLPVTASVVLVMQLCYLYRLKRNLPPGEQTNQNNKPVSSNEETTVNSGRGNLMISYTGYYGLSVLITFILFFVFISVGGIKYRELFKLINFLAFFEVVVLLFTLLIRSLLVSVIQRLGNIKIILRLTPVVLIALLVSVLFVSPGKSLGEAATGPITLFLFLGVLTLVSRSLLIALIVPLESLFIKRGNQRQWTRRCVETKTLIGACLVTIASFLLFLIPDIVDLKVALLILPAILFSLGLLRIALILRRDYRHYLKKLTLGDEDITCDPMGKGKESSALFYDFIHFNDPAILISGNEPGELWEDERFSAISIRRALSHWGCSALPLLYKLSFRGEETVKKLATDAIQIIERKSGDIYKTPDITGVAGQKLILTDLIRMMRDPDQGVRRIAILIAGRDKLYDLIPDLCDALLIDNLAREAFSVLKQFGEKTFRSLGALYYRSSTPLKVRVLIIRLFVASKSDEGSEFLAESFFSVHRELRKEALKGLLECEYKPGREMRERLKAEVDRVIDIIAWNSAASVTFTRSEDYEMVDFIGADSEWWYRYLFGIISLIYGKYAMAMVCDNINKGDGGSYAEARELFDIVIDYPLKKRLLVLISVLSGKSSPAKLISNAGLETLQPRQLYATMINMDYNQVSVWVKCCALRRLYDFDEFADFKAVTALLFSPYEILREEAARFLREKKIIVWKNSVDRIPVSYRDHLEDIVSGRIPEKDELFYKTKQLHYCFPQVNPLYLISLASSTIRESIVSAERDTERDPCIILFGMNEKGDQCDGGLQWDDYDADILSDKEFMKEEPPVIYRLSIERVTEELFRHPELHYSLVPVLSRMIERSCRQENSV